MSWFKLLLFRIFGSLLIAGIFLYELTLSSIKVLWWIYTKRSKVESEIYELELSLTKNWQKILISHFITLTPGTLTIDWVEPNSLLIHCLDRSSWPGTVDLVKKRLEPLLSLMESSK